MDETTDSQLNVETPSMAGEGYPDEDVATVYRDLKQAIGAQCRKDWLDRRKECWRFYVGKQWTEDEELQLTGKEMAALKWNLIFARARTKRNLATSSDPQWVIHPEGSGDTGFAELCKRKLDERWDRCDGRDILGDALMDYLLGGFGASDVELDESLFPSSRMAYVDDRNVYLDPRARRLSWTDERYRIKGRLITIKFAKDRYGLTDEECVYRELGHDIEDGREKDDDGYDSYTEAGGANRGDLFDRKPRQIWEIEHWALEHVKAKLLQNATTDEIIGRIDGMDKAALSQLALEQTVQTLGTTGQAPQWKVTERTIKQFRLRVVVGDKLVENKVNPLGDQVECSLKLLPGQRAERGPYPISIAWHALDPQRDYNKAGIQLIYARSKASGGALFIPKESIAPEDHERVCDPAAVIEYDSEKTQVGKGIHRNPPGSMEIVATSLQSREMNEKFIDQLFGTQAPLRGEETADVKSGKHALMLQEAGSLDSADTVRAIQTWMMQTGRVLLLSELLYAPDKAWTRLVQNDPKDLKVLGPALQELLALRDNPDTLGKLLDFDVKVGVNAGQPTNRLARLDMNMELDKAQVYTRAAAGDPGARMVLENLDDPHAQAVVAEAEPLMQANQRIDELTATLAAVAQERDTIAQEHQKHLEARQAGGRG